MGLINFFIDKNFIISKQKEKIALLNKEIRDSEKKKEKVIQETLKLTKIKESERISIYESIRRAKISDSKLFNYKAIEIDVLKNKRFLGLFGGLNTKSYIMRFGNDNQIQVLGIPEDISATIDLFKKEKYIIKPYSPYFYNGKRVFFLTPDSPLNLELDLKKESLLCNSETFHALINNVVDYKLTNPAQTGIGNIGEFIKKYWIIILVLIIVYVLYQNGSLNFML